MSKKLSLIFISLLLFVAIAPLSVLAADDTNVGNIVVDVVDQDNKSFPGMWYLRQGGKDGMVLRNGAYGENFTFGIGTWYLESHPKNPDYPYYLMASTNPQVLTAGGKITFKLQYFKNEAEKLVAEALASTSSSTSTSTSTTTSTTTTSTTTSTALVYPDLEVSSLTYGVSSGKGVFTAIIKNSGVGMAGKSMTATIVEGNVPTYYNVPSLTSGETYTIEHPITVTTSYYNVTVKADTYNDVKEYDELNNSKTINSSTSPVATTTNTNTSSTITPVFVYAPQFDTAPITTTTSSPATTTSSSLTKVPTLAATGPATLGLLALAPMMAGLVIRKRK